MSRPGADYQFTSARQACDPGPCEVGYDSRTCMRRCKHCGIPSQDLVDGERHPIDGDFRVVCAGPVDSEETACPIGPSRPTPHITTAQELLADHQTSARERDGVAHDVKIVQLTRD